jgi:hypothetical protein
MGEPRVHWLRDAGCSFDHNLLAAVNWWEVIAEAMRGTCHVEGFPERFSPTSIS